MSFGYSPTLSNPSEENSKTSSPAASPLPRWSLQARIAFRFAFAYLVLYCLPGRGRVSLLAALPWGGEFLAQLSDWPWHVLCPFAAIHVFHVSGLVTQYHPTGSGDTTLDYVQVFCFFAVAVFATILWSVLDRQRRHYRSLYPWLRLLVRFTLAFTMLCYGFVKVYPLQFSMPGLSRLTESYGESSPMGLLWTFMGASTAYTMFCGLAEVSGGLLLLFRRTTMLGTLVSGAVLLNIVLLNFCYDVPVKLYSVHLLLMSVFLLLPDMPAFWSFFILHQASRPAGVWVPRFERRWLRISALALQILVIASVLFSNLRGGYEGIKQYAVMQQHPPTYGIWNVDNNIRPGWQQVTFNSIGSLTVRTTQGERLSFMTTYDQPKHSITVRGWRNPHAGELTYQQPDKAHLLLAGKLDGQPLTIQLHQFPASQFLLTSRGFHWISEDPFNR